MSKPQKFLFGPFAQCIVISHPSLPSFCARAVPTITINQVNSILSYRPGVQMSVSLSDVSLLNCFGFCQPQLRQVWCCQVLTLDFIYFVDFVLRARVKTRRKSFFSLNQIVGCFCFMMKLKIEKWNFPPGHFFRQMMWKTLSESSWEVVFIKNLL